MQGSIPALHLVETIKRATKTASIAETIDRRQLFGAQTRKAFPSRRSWRRIARPPQPGASDFTDDAAIAEWVGLPVKLVEGSADNVKITWPRDIQMAEQRMSGGFPDVRTGNGYDVHAFEPGDHVTLCGVAIPHDKKLSGHSDADVALHALTDALLATCGAGDIGTHFPPSDPQWRGAASRIFVEHAVAIVRARGGRIANADITLICEAPRIGPHRDGNDGGADRNARHFRRPDFGQSDDQRAARLHRARGGHRRDRDGNRRLSRESARMTDIPDKKHLDQFSDLPQLADRFLKACFARKFWLRRPKSCTGGMIISLLTDIPGSSSMVDRGFVTYSNDAKIEMLGVSATTLDAHGAVSRETALEMATGALARSHAGIALAVTGIAGPDGGSAEKPVGLVWFGLAMTGEQPIAEKRQFDNQGRDYIRRQTVRTALEMGLTALKGD